MPNVRTNPASRLPDARRAIVTVIVTRVAILVVAIAAAYFAGRHGGWLHGPLRDLLITPWTRKDAGWFVAIAQEGYAPRAVRAAFFPLYPLLIRAASVLTLGSYWVAGIVASLACYAGAMLLLFRLTSRETTPRTAADTVLLISVFPTAFVFSAVYSESLFLLCIVAVFLCARSQRWALAGIAASLATLTRSSGLILFVPVLLFYGEQQGWTLRRPALSWPRDARLLWLLLVPAGLAAYMGYLWIETGNALLFANAQQTYWHRTLEWPWVDAWRGARAAYRGLNFTAGHLSSLPSGLLPGHQLQVVMVRTLLPFGALLFAVLCLVIVFRRLPIPYGVYCLLALLLPLLEPSSTVPLYSFHRFVLVVFPLFMGLALVLEGRRTLLWTVAALSFTLMLYFTICFTSGVRAAHGVV